MILYAKGMGHQLAPLLHTGASILSMDWTIDLRRTRQSIGKQTAIQGNLDPVLLTTNPETVTREAQRILEEIAHSPGFIFNLGNGMLPSAKIECVEALMKVVTGINHLRHLYRRRWNGLCAAEASPARRSMHSFGICSTSRRRCSTQRRNGFLAEEGPNSIQLESSDAELLKAFPASTIKLSKPDRMRIDATSCAITSR